MTPPHMKRGKSHVMMSQPFMSTRFKHEFEINAKIRTKFEGAFAKPKKRKKAT